MMKKIKFVGIAAAALLTLAPAVVSTTATAHAANTTYASANDYTSYFTYKGVRLNSNGSHLSNGSGIEITAGEKITLQELLDKMESMVEFHGGSKKDKITTTTSDLYSYLSNQNISVTENSPTGVVTIPDKDFSLMLSGSDPQPKLSTVWVNFSFHPVAATTSPVIRVNYTQNSFDISDVVQDQIFQVAEGSKFDPTDFVGSNGTRYQFSATASSNDTASVKVSGDGNKVDTSKAGSQYKVTLTATNKEGKETKSSYTIYVKPKKAIVHDSFSGYSQWYTYNASGYNMNAGGNNIPSGTQVYVGNDTLIIDGVSYTKFSEKSEADANSGNKWIPTKNIMNGNMAVSKTIMHKSVVYDASGKSKGKTLAAYSKVNVKGLTVTIKGKEYYQIDGTSDYVKAANIDGTLRTLKHNAYVYATSTRRANKDVLPKGGKVRTYGSSYTFKNGKKYYRIEGASKTKKMYVKVANFK